MLTSEQVIKLMEQQAGEITSRILCDLIKDNRVNSDRMAKLWNEYKGDTAIKSRKFDNTSKINRKIANDYRGIITDEVVGYLFGRPIQWSIAENVYTDDELNKFNETIKDFTNLNHYDDLNNTTSTYTTVCGQGARLLYIDKNGNERTMNIKPWEVIFIEDSTLDEMQYAMLYYPVQVETWNKQLQTKYKVEWYDKQNVSYFIGTTESGFKPDDTGGETVQRHMFDGIPVIQFKNNDTLTGDFEKVSELIDNYDRILSDVQNEIEEFRLAYLVAYGIEPSPEVLLQARQTGMFAVGSETGKERLEFLTKQMNDGAIENHKKTLRNNIYLFSKTVDMSDENFSGASQTGESRKWKMIDLENKAINKERKYTKSLHDELNLITQIWNMKGIRLDPYDVTFILSRNMPTENQSSANLRNSVKDLLSTRSQLELLPFVKDVDKELERIEEEKKANMALIPPALQTINNSVDTSETTPEDDATPSDEMDGDMKNKEIMN